MRFVRTANGRRTLTLLGPQCGFLLAIGFFSTPMMETFGALGLLDLKIEQVSSLPASTPSSPTDPIR